MQPLPSWQLAHQIEERLRPRYLQRRAAALAVGDATTAAHWEAKLLALELLVVQFDAISWDTRLAAMEAVSSSPFA